jgi:hypothetical protein
VTGGRLFGKRNSDSESPEERLSLHQIEVEINLLIAKLKFILGRDKISREIPPNKRAEIADAIRQEFERLQTRTSSTAIQPLPTRLPVVSRPTLAQSRTVRVRQPRQKSRKRAASSTRQSHTPQIIDFVPVTRTNGNLAVPRPSDLVAETVRQLASRHRQKAVKRGDIVEALLAAYVEQEATKAAYAPPSRENDYWS